MDPKTSYQNIWALVIPCMKEPPEKIPFFMVPEELSFTKKGLIKVKGQILSGKVTEGAYLNLDQVGLCKFSYAIPTGSEYNTRVSSVKKDDDCSIFLELHTQSDSEDDKEIELPETSSYLSIYAKREIDLKELSIKLKEAFNVQISIRDLKGFAKHDDWGYFVWRIDNTISQALQSEEESIEETPANSYQEESAQPEDSPRETYTTEQIAAQFEGFAINYTPDQSSFFGSIVNAFAKPVSRVIIDNSKFKDYYLDHALKMHPNAKGYKLLFYAKSEDCSFLVHSGGISYQDIEGIFPVQFIPWNELESISYSEEELNFIVTDDALISRSFTVKTALPVAKECSVEDFVQVILWVGNIFTPEPETSQDAVTNPLQISQVSETGDPTKDPAVIRAIERYKLQDVLEDKNFIQFLPAIALMNQVDEMIDNISKTAAFVDSSISMLREEIAELGEMVNEGLSSFGKKTSGVVAELALNVAGEFYAKYKEEQNRQRKEKQQQIIKEMRAKIAKARIDNLYEARTVMVSTFPKILKLYELEKGKTYSMDDDKIEKKVKAFHLIFILFAKSTYLKNLTCAFIEIFGKWKEGTSANPKLPKTEEVFNSLMEDWKLSDAELHQYLTQESGKIPVTLAYALLNPAVAKILLPFKELEKDSDDSKLPLSLAGVTYNSKEETPFAPSIRKHLEKNEYYKKTVKLSVNKPEGVYKLWIYAFIGSLVWMWFGSANIWNILLLIISIIGWIWGYCKYSSNISAWQKNAQKEMVNFKLT